MKPKFIYFDVGGVAVLDFSKTEKWQQMLDDLKLLKENQEEVSRLWDKHAGEICTGRDTDEVAEEIFANLQPPFQLPANYSMLEDFVARFEKNEELLKIIEELKENYSVGLLTNMYPRMLEKIFERGLLPANIWDVVVDSSELKMKKPDLDIYQYAQEAAGVKPEEILFLDNTEGHLEVPSELGWQTMLYDPGDVASSSKQFLSFLA